MEGIKKENIINEDNEIINYNSLKKIINSKLEKCICKIKQEINNNGKNCLITGTGFFCNIPLKNIKIFVTNNHVLNKEFIYKEKKLILFVEEEKKEINLDINRYKLTNEELDFTIIEILEEDKINNYLEIDEYINSFEYEEEQIFSIQYQKGEELKYSHGKVIEKLDIYFQYSLGTDKGSSGSPIILLNNLKLIGLHKGKYKKGEKEIFPIGIPMNIIINKMNYIKCIYNIEKENVGKEIQILNNEYNYFDDFFKNYEIEKNIKVIIEGDIKSCIFKYKFKKEGKYIIYYIEEIILRDMSYMFNKCKYLEKIDLSSFNADKITNMSGMFCECSSLKEINLSSFNTDEVTDMSLMFCECSSLKEINLSSFNTDKVTNMRSMFYECSSLKEINLSSFNTDKVTNMKSMFNRCSSLKEINLSSFNTDKVTNMSAMFCGCSSLKEINLSSFNTDKVINMKQMFYFCTSLKEINLLSFNTDKVTDMSLMFCDCWSLKELNLSSFNTDKVTYMSKIFDFMPTFSKLICNNNKLITEFNQKRTLCNIF